MLSRRDSLEPPEDSYSCVWGLKSYEFDVISMIYRIHTNYQLNNFSPLFVCHFFGLKGEVFVEKSGFGL